MWCFSYSTRHISSKISNQHHLTLKLAMAASKTNKNIFSLAKSPPSQPILFNYSWLCAESTTLGFPADSNLYVRVATCCIENGHLAYWCKPSLCSSSPNELSVSVRQDLNYYSVCEWLFLCFKDFKMVIILSCWNYIYIRHISLFQTGYLYMS